MLNEEDSQEVKLQELVKNVDYMVNKMKEEVQYNFVWQLSLQSKSYVHCLNSYIKHYYRRHLRSTYDCVGEHALEPVHLGWPLLQDIPIVFIINLVLS